MLVKYPIHARVLCEFVGTFTLCAVGVGAVVNGSNDLIGVAFAHGLAIAVMVCAVAHISGAHLNPAVTLALAAVRKSSPMDTLIYVVAQLAGGVAGAALVKWTYETAWTDASASVVLGPGISSTEGLVLELAATLLLVWTVFAVAVDRDGAFFKVAGLPIGFAVTMDILWIGPATGATMNPARWFGPNVLTGEFANAQVWIVGPIVGGVIAALLYMYVVKPRLPEEAAA